MALRSVSETRTITSPRQLASGPRTSMFGVEYGARPLPPCLPPFLRAFPPPSVPSPLPQRPGCPMPLSRDKAREIAGNPEMTRCVS